MADFTDLGTIANDAGFRQRCLYAAYVQAIYTMNNVSNPANSLIALCVQITSGGLSGSVLALIAVANPTIAAEANIADAPGWNVADQDIQTAISEAFNAMAGIPAL
jgi:hypothetical protein